ncbi:MAG TPA: ABC transporter permease [Chthoniobacterales bacterium]|nr:ABC transporter permease [Chthoniobacterales bacterium]
MLTDLRFALRQLLKSPGFSILAIITLALGIGVNTAIFSLLHDLFLRGLTFENPDRLVIVEAEAKERNLEHLPMSVPRFWHFRDGQTVFSDIAADTGSSYIMTGAGDPVQTFGADVTANYMQTLGIQPILGRLFRPEEEMKADVALVTDAFWRQHLGSDPNIIGHSLTLNGVATTVVGVIRKPPVAWWGPDAAIFTVKPFHLQGMTQERLMRGLSYLRVVGRLKPGLTITQARAAMPVLAQSYRAQWPDNADNSWTPVIVTATQTAFGNLRDPFLLLLAAVAAVLLIACSNVANLLLVRFSGRRREIALRMALGASRRGVVRLFVFESTLISLVAGVVGVGLALWLVSLAPKLAADNLPLEKGVGLNPAVLWFTLALSLLTGVVMGVYPAWQSSRADLVDGLKEGGRAVSGSKGQQRFRRGLVAAQVGLSVVLLAGAALLIASFVRLSNQEAGFNPKHLWTAIIALPATRYPDDSAIARFADRLQTELKNTPGVEAAAVTDGLPLTGNSSASPYTRAEGNPLPLTQRPLGLTRAISPGLLQTLGIPLLAGRDFNERDDVDRPPVVLLSKATAQRLFPNENPIGKRMWFGTDNNTGYLTEIIGVVGDVRSLKLDKKNDVEFYRPFAQRTSPFVWLAVKTNGKVAATTQLVKSALGKIDSGIPIIQPNSMEEIVNQSLGPRRLTMTLLGGFAAIALLLAMVGIYGAVAYTIEQRTGEIGVRMALGAQTVDVLRLVVRQGMSPVIIGLAIGLAAALALGRLLTTQLYEVSATNPLFLAGTAALLALVGFCACLIPARRATLVNPIEALRAE